MQSVRDAYYFISDVHLGIRGSENSRIQEYILLKFLDSISANAKEIYIAGDLFDAWIEYRQVVPKGYYKLFTKISDLRQQGVEIYYLAGNHDFWRGTYFKEEFGIDIKHEHIEKLIEGKSFYIHHGDGLAYKDTGYKILKAILRSRVSQFFYSLLHPDFGLWLAKKTSGSSRKHTEKKDYSERDGMRDFGIKKINEGFNFVIMGHRHKPLIINADKGYYINLGDWITNFSYGLYQNGIFRLKKFYDIDTSEIINEDIPETKIQT